MRRPGFTSVQVPSSVRVSYSTVNRSCIPLQVENLQPPPTALYKYVKSAQALQGTYATITVRDATAEDRARRVGSGAKG